jgi:hypothetical protein
MIGKHYSPQRRTTAWMQELEQRMEQLPKEHRETIYYAKSQINQ